MACTMPDTGGGSVKYPSSLIPAISRQDLELIWGGGKQRTGGLGTQWAPHPTANGAGENLG